MSSDDRVAALKAKHAELDAALDQENRRPNPDSAEITKLKRRKLMIKDELHRLSHH